ncbi:flagellar hook-basal body complex protein FliE [Marinibacterium profundimaris]|uniref:Flagellar hook-basal body complex protein FliE n=1 Tax=Marinibacterium profundimaris TaxID=1679460 RepID=A0A225NNJ0_9RHOB|nr:flagellar hook-basal body complex protein FliE [Marinibacterium profundimaris]OWU75859.1 flagellar hook-basal body protein FliE [Marinibacterium profundimaris]
MDLNAISAARGYAQARPATEADTATAAVTPAEAAKEAVTDFAQTLAEGEAVARSAMTGDADPHALVHALAQTELAVETAITVRDKVVEAYQEILRMPV